TLALGSAAPGGPYRMLLTVTNRGAAITRLGLSSSEFSDIDRRYGSLGVLDLSNAPDSGVLLGVVGAGTPAADAGLAEGDVILSGKPVEKRSKLKPAEFPNAAALNAWLSGSKLGESVELAIAASEENGQDARTVTVKLARPALQVIRPESENVLMHQRQLPKGFEDAPSLLVRLARVNDMEASSDELKAANKRLTEENWSVDASDGQSATLSIDLPKLGLKVTKSFGLIEISAESQAEKDFPGYHFDFRIGVENLRSKPQSVAYELEGPNGLPIEGYWYANKIGRKANGAGAWSGVGLRDVIVRTPRVVSQMNPGYIAKDKYEEFGQGIPLAYFGIDAQYFATMLIPQKETVDEVWFDYGDTKLATAKLDEKVRPTLNNATFTLTRQPVTLAAAGGDKGHSHSDGFVVFAGPKRPELLAQYYPPNTPVYNLGDILYYGWFGPVAHVMLSILHAFYSVVRNYGVAILLLTVVVRLCMYPLSRKQAMNMVKMQELKPEIDRIAEKYKNDMEKRSKAQQDLFRKHNYNPMGGCLLMFIQLPIFLGLYRALAVDVELREAPLISQFVQFCSNLAAPDMFYNWSWLMPHSVNTGVGFFGLGPYLNLLPIITIVLFLAQQKMFMPEPTNEQAAMQQKMMKYMMV
ncbi:MAG: YidC/Oxa1 family insertase periplasmic-domain containing protein, partial [Planctomycetales bacterium]|nr:YidC/Oxa1 family insertase periplasmic-domain containing protein [Planctomycetales bacterium]